MIKTLNFLLYWLQLDKYNTTSSKNKIPDRFSSITINIQEIKEKTSIKGSFILPKRIHI